MSDRLLASDAASLALVEQIPAGIEVLAGTPTASYRDVAALGDTSVGVWEMTSGRARDVESAEVFIVLAGAGTVTFADGEVIELRPGVVVRLEEGDQTDWVVTETLRKLYVAG